MVASCIIEIYATGFYFGGIMFKKKKYILYYRARMVLRLGILIFLCAFIIMAILSYYTSYSGDFVISIDEDSKASLSLCEHRNFDNPISVLHAKAENDAHPIEYKEIKFDKILNTDGSANQRNCFGYTYYLKNTGKTIVDIDVDIIQKEATKNLDKCARFMLLQDDVPIGVFKVEDNFIDQEDTTPINLYKQYNNSNVYTLKLFHVLPGDIIKFSVII